MAGMWELPSYEPEPGETPGFTVRHAITVTNHVVDVYVMQAGIAGSIKGEWTPLTELPRRALTGLTRKVLRRLGCIS
jgi:hypothetical protein